MEHQNKAHVQKVTAATLLVALGIIYGDIGTSPLYVLKAIVGTKQVSDVLVYGGVSLIFWTLVFQTSIKYIWLTLQADNHGEGGIFSLYALVKRFGKKLVIPAMIGATTLLADGIITPPISVASAVEGLTIVKGLENLPTVPIVILILSFLFFFQRFGTQKVGVFFGPAMVVWFSMLFIMGMSHIIHHPDIFKALSPHYAYELLVQYPHGFWILGAVFLATTGAEALYSDLGHCGIKNIRITWVFVKTSLVINYLGQAAWLMHTDIQHLSGKNPFFEMMPPWFLLTGIFIATSAAIIASQALISGSFTLINEAMNLNFWPRVKVRQPSDTKGQIYIPSVNFLLWVGCLFVILFFQNSSNMEAAYGLAITITMMMTTILLGTFLLYRLKWKKQFVYTIIPMFLIIELSFFVANIQKFPEGGYITLIISSVFFFVMFSIYSGRKITNRLTKFVTFSNYIDHLKELSNDDSIPKFSTHLIYLSKADRKNEIEEKIMRSIFSKKPKRADVYWFLHLDRTEDPYTLSYDVSEIVDDTIIKVNIRIGFRIFPKTEMYFKKIVQDLVANKELNLHIRPDGSTKYNNEPDFKFVVIEKFLSVENEFTIKEGILLNAYFFMKKLAQKDEAAFGLDKSDVVIEHVPLVFEKVTSFNLIREHKKKKKLN